MYYLYAVAIIVVAGIWSVVLDDGERMFSADLTRLVNVLVMLAVIAVLFIVGFSTNDDFGKGMHNAKRVLGRM